MSRRTKSRGDATRQALVLAAIEVFGRDGFHAASTRGIAAQAEVNQAAIGYHFGGKEALYLAAIEHIAERIAERIGPIVQDIRVKLDEMENLDMPAQEATTKHLRLLLQLLKGMLRMLVGRESSSWARLILREQQSPTPAFDVFYQGLMGQALKVITELVGKIRGIEPDSEEARILSITVFGHILVFRASRAAILRYMGWPDFSENQVERIWKQIESNVTTMLTHGENK